MPMNVLDEKMPKKGRHLAQLIREFVRSFPKLQRQRGAYNKCKFMSYELVLFLRRRGFNAKLIHIQGCPAPTYPEPHPVWAAKRRDRWSHYVVGIGRWSIDVTARQFDSEARVPLVMPLAELRQQWTVVEEDKFLNRLVEDVLAANRLRS